MAKKHYAQILTKEQAIADAKRYLSNAKETISKSPISSTGKLYSDAKYVREGAGIAYLAALKAIDGWLIGQGVPYDKLPKSIEEYWLAKKKIPQNGKFTDNLTLAYQNLHIAAYYHAQIDINIIKDGLLAVKEIIKMLEK
jgi:hypothetical protein